MQPTNTQNLLSPLRTLDVQTDKASPALMRLRQHVDERLIGLRVDRYSFWAHWRDLADYFLPRRYKWLVTPNQAARGSPINQRIIDGTTQIVVRILGAGMMEGMTSPGRPWFQMTLHDPDLAEYPPVKAWLSACRDRMLMIMGESNFYNCLATMYPDLGVFGTAPMIIYEDFDDVIRCFNTCAGEYYLANGPRMDSDTLYREFVLTTRQTAQMFGAENCTETVKGAIRTGGAMLTREVKICHAIEPNDASVPPVPGLRGRAYREVYWEFGSGHIYVLRVRGFHEKPFVAPRWDIVANDAYGRSPGMDALGDAKQLMTETKRKAQAIDKLVNPPLLADVALKNEPASMLPGGVTYVPSLERQGGMKPVYEVKPDLAAMLEDIKEVQQRIGRHFFADLFQMWAEMEGVQPRNEMEIAERRGEKLIQLGPVLERFQNEALDPAIDRIFGIMQRARLLPPPPAEIQGQPIKIQYISMLAESQKAMATAGIERLAAFVGRIAGAVPDSLDNVDWDEAIEEYAELLGVSPKLVKPMAKVLQLRAQRAQQQAQQNALQTGMALTQGAQTLSQTDVGGGRNALQMMLGQEGEKEAA